MCTSQSSLSLDNQKHFSNMLSFLDALVHLDLQMEYLKVERSVLISFYHINPLSRNAPPGRPTYFFYLSNTPPDNFTCEWGSSAAQGWIRHDLVGGGGGGGGALPALVPSCVCHLCRPPSTCFTTAKCCLTTVFEL
jgi:hypothetical protein